MIVEPFVPIGIGFSFHPKLSDLRRKGPAFYGKAVALWVLARLHVEREHTGGVVPDVDLRLIYDTPDVAKLAAALVEVGLWDRHARGFAVHDVETSGGVVAPDATPEARDPRAAARARRKARNRKYRETRKTSPETGPGVSRDGAETSRVSPRDVSGDSGETSRETPPSQTLPPSETLEGRSGDARETPSHETPRDASRDGETRRVPVWGDLPSLVTPGSSEQPWSFVEAAYRRAFDKHTGKTPGRSIRWRADFETLAETLLDHCRRTDEDEHSVLARVLDAHFETADDFTKKRGYPPATIGERFGILEAYGAPETAPGAMAGWAREAEETRRAVEHLQ